MISLPHVPFLRRTILGSCLILFALAAVDYEAAAASSNRPNVLFISVDDMNDWVRCLGGYPGEIHTPNIDRLAERGLLFTNAHADAPVCNASRTAILTGMRPSTTGVYTNQHWWRPNLPQAVSLPEQFRSSGYYAAGGGKVFHHMPGFNPPDQWDTYFDLVFEGFNPFDSESPTDARGRPRWPARFPLNNIENVKLGKRPPQNPLEFDWGPIEKSDLEVGDGQMARWAVEFLGQEQREPFFLASGIYRPHLPWYIPEQYFNLYDRNDIRLPLVKENDLNDVPATGKDMAKRLSKDFDLLVEHNKWTEAVRAYLASISYADSLVGRILDALDASPYGKNTIIVFWSDHGYHLGEKGTWHKTTLWERATRVPFIIVAPEVTLAGTRCSRPVNLVDIYPTLLELCGLPKPDGLDGVSLVPLLRDPAANWERSALTTHLFGNHAVRSEHWRYIRYADGGEELYDHRNDPNEWTNLAGDPQYADTIRGHVRWLPAHNAEPVSPKKAFSFDLKTYTWVRR